MENLFKCNQNDNENIPLELISNTKLEFPKLHTNSNDIAYLSHKLKEYKNDIMCKLPFCTTVEAEAMGANIKLGDEKNSPRINEYAFNNIKDLLDIKKINIDRGRIREVLDAISILKDEGEIVVLNICGPFTIMSSLIDQKHFYKALRKDRCVIEKILELIEDNIVEYAIKGAQNGADIISYSDPVASLEIVGPKVYKDIVGDTTIKTLKKIDEVLDSSIIHLCGRVSTDMEIYEYCKSQKLDYNGSITYGNAICNLAEDQHKFNIFIGHNCMKKTPYKLNLPYLYKIEIN